MNRLLSVFGVVGLLAFSLLFAYLNSGQRVTLRLGFTTLFGVPLTAIAFGSVIAGMVVMLVAGVRSDMKVRRILRARLHEENREELGRFVDDSQQDLFDAPNAAMSEARDVWTPLPAAPPLGAAVGTELDFDPSDDAPEIETVSEAAAELSTFGPADPPEDREVAPAGAAELPDDREATPASDAADDDEDPFEWRPIDASP